MRPNVYDTGSWILMGLALFLVLLVHLVPALLVGLAVYELVQFVVQTLNIVQIRRRRAKLMAIGLVGVGVVAFIGLPASE